MALMSGLVEVKDQIDGSHQSTIDHTIGHTIGEWLIRNAVVVVLGACALFWAAVGALFIFV